MLNDNFLDKMSRKYRFKGYFFSLDGQTGSGYDLFQNSDPDKWIAQALPLFSINRFRFDQQKFSKVCFSDEFLQLRVLDSDPSI